MGSGETGPSMTKVHRALLSRLDQVRAVALDTSYAFQANVPQMTEKIVDYFATSLQLPITPLHYGSHASTPPVNAVRFRQDVRQANYVFAGPGSPSFALSQWRDVNLEQELEHVLAEGGVVCFASAAALTLGAVTAPIYEIYKAGAEPYWLDGLDVLALAGLKCAVIPHYDNAEGGNYDTRFCYLGEERLCLLESALPDDTGVLGIDEHTAALIDLAQQTITVIGRSNAYWRISGATTVLKNGTTTALSSLQVGVPQIPTRSFQPSDNDDEVHELVARAQLPGQPGLEALASLARRAEMAREGTYDPSELVNGLLILRNEARSQRNFQLADRIRDVLLNAHIDVMDSVEGPSWSIAPR